jgi:ABC-type transport system involved in multi-copper enzyme maturation permease subunit
MPGSWFALEFRRCRRGYLDVLCQIYTAWLAVQWTLMGIISAAGNQGRQTTSPGALSSSFVGDYLGVFVVQRFLLLALVTPPLVAGLVSDERAKGTLALLLATPLASWEMITAKLLGRLTDVGYLALLGLPLLAFTGGYGHLSLLPLLALPAVTVGLAFALGAASLLASVRSARTRDAVLRVYLWCALAFGGAWSLAWGLGQAIPRLVPGTTPHSWAVRVEAALHWLSPLYVLDTFWEVSDPGTLARRVLTAVLAWGTLGLDFSASRYGGFGLPPCASWTGHGVPAREGGAWRARPWTTNRCAGRNG